MNILLISGHGAGDPGACATVNGKRYKEADEARKLNALIAEKLKGVANVTLYPTSHSAYSDYKAGKLNVTAQFAKYDYVLETHFNAYKKDPGDGATKGVECYVTNAEKGVGVETAICKNIAALGFKNRGVKRYDWAVIKTAKNAGVSSALLEVCFIDDADDMKLYEANRDKVAVATAQGIADGFGVKMPKVSEVDQAKKTIKEKAGLSDATIDYLAKYKYGDDLLKKLAAAMK